MCLAGILLLASFFRLFHLDRVPGGLYPDEGMNGNNAVEVLETGHPHVFYPENNGREGLYIATLALLLKVYPHYKPWVERLPAAVSGILTTLGAYLVASEMFAPLAALLGTFFVATGVWPVMMARIGFRANFSLLLITWAVYLALVAFRDRTARGVWLGALSGFAAGLSLYTYIPVRSMPPLFIVPMLLYACNRDGWRRLGVLYAAAAVTALPLVLYFARHPGTFMGRANLVSVGHSPHPLRTALRWSAVELGMLNVRGDRNWRHNISGASELGPIVGLLLWVGVYFGWRLFRSARQNTGLWKAVQDRSNPLGGLLLLVVWFILAFIPPAIAEPPHALRSILLITPSMLLAGWGCAELGSLLRQRGYGRLLPQAAAALCLTLAAYTYVRYFHTYAGSPHLSSYFRSQDLHVAAQINALPMAMTKVVIVRSPPQEVYVGSEPIAAQSVMFLTHSYTLPDRAARHIIYVPVDRVAEVPKEVPRSQIFYIGRLDDGI